MPVRIVTGPGSEPVTLSEAKSHLRLEESVDDTFVASCISGARQYLEKFCWRGFIEQTLELTQNGFRGADKQEQLSPYVQATPEPYPVQTQRFQPYIELPFGHLAATPAIAVTYLDENGSSQVLSSSVYVVEGQGNDSMCGRLWLAANQTWPNAFDQFNSVTVSYKVGWTTSNIPIPIKNAVLLMVSHMYENRVPIITGTIASPLDFTIDALLTPYRLVRL